MKLFDDESVLFRSDDHKLILTTHRVLNGLERGAEFKVIMLEDVCSVAVTRMTYPWLWRCCIIFLVLAGILGWMALRTTIPTVGNPTAAIAQMRLYESDAYVALFISAIFCLAYAFTRWSMVEIASAGHRIEWRIPRKSAEYVVAFVSDLEAAKNERYMLLARVRDPQTVA